MEPIEEIKMEFLGKLPAGNGDMLAGTFKDGFFRPYGYEDYLEAILDPLSDSNVKKLVKEGIEIHGSLKGGNFRAFDKYKRRFHISYVFFKDKKFGVNFDGDILDDAGLVIGKILSDGSMFLNKKEKLDSVSPRTP